MKYPMSAGFR